MVDITYIPFSSQIHLEDLAIIRVSESVIAASFLSYSADTDEKAKNWQGHWGSHSQHLSSCLDSPDFTSALGGRTSFSYWVMIQIEAMWCMWYGFSLWPRSSNPVQAKADGFFQWIAMGVSPVSGERGSRTKIPHVTNLIFSRDYSTCLNTSLSPWHYH